MQVTLEQSEALCSIGLKGEMSIAAAGELKAALLRGLACGTEVTVDVAGATGIDVTALQLLWAAEREARRSGHSLTLAGGLPEELLLAASEAGFEAFPVASRSEYADSSEATGRAAVVEGAMHNDR